MSTMFLRLQQFHAVKPKFTNFKKLYCSDKFKKLLDISLKEDKKTELLQQSSIAAENFEECAQFEQKVLKQVLIEKEKDATLRSRLSKECKTLFTTPANKSVGTRPLHLDKLTLKNGPDCQDWGSYSFEQLQTKMSANNLILGSVKKDDGSSGPVKNENSTDKVYHGGKLPSFITGGGHLESGDLGGTSEGGVMTATTKATRPVRQEPGKVIFCFIPEEWWHFFIPITGVTGFGTFVFALSTFLISKEYYVLEHYYYHGLGALFLWIGAIKYVGPLLAKMLDKDIDTFEKEWNKGRMNEKQSLEDSTVYELFLQYQMDGQLLLLEAKRENVKLQLEEEFRKRQMMVYNEVKQRLDYHIALELVKQRMQQKNLVDYVTREVKKAITPEMQSKLIYYSIDRIVDDLNQEKK